MKHQQSAINYSSSQRDYNCKLQICHLLFIKYFLQKSLFSSYLDMWKSNSIQTEFMLPRAHCLP